MRLAANLDRLFTEHPFAERFDAAAAAGFHGVECYAPYVHEPAVLSRRLTDAGLELVAINTPTGPAESPGRSGWGCIPDHVPEFRAAVSHALEYATALGSSYIHLMGGIRPPEVRPDEAFATFVTNAAWAAEQASDTGVTFVLETQNQRDVPGFVLDTVEQAASIIRAVDSASLGLMFDVYHCQVSQGDVITRLRALLPIIRHVQIADPPLRSEPGTGELNWHTIFGELRALQYAGWIGCEFNPLGSTESGLTWRDEFGF